MAIARWMSGLERPAKSEERTMPLSIKNPEVERLAAEVAELAGETKTEAVRRALEERRRRLSFRITSRDRGSRLRRLLETELWPLVPDSERGRRLSPREEDEVLGYGEDGF